MIYITFNWITKIIQGEIPELSPKEYAMEYLKTLQVTLLYRQLIDYVKNA